MEFCPSGEQDTSDLIGKHDHLSQTQKNPRANPVQDNVAGTFIDFLSFTVFFHLRKYHMTLKNHSTNG